VSTLSGKFLSGVNYRTQPAELYSTINPELLGEHLWWRLLVTEDSDGGTYISFAEVEFFTAESPITTVVPVIYDNDGNSYYDAYDGVPIYSAQLSSYNAYEAFNGTITSDGWATHNNDYPPAYIGFHFLTQKEIIGVRTHYYGYYGQETYARQFALEFSDDGINWTRKLLCTPDIENLERYGSQVFWFDAINVIDASLPLHSALGEMVSTNNSEADGTTPSYTAEGVIDLGNNSELAPFESAGELLAGAITNGFQHPVTMPSFTGEGNALNGSIGETEVTLPDYECNAVVVLDHLASLPAYEAGGIGLAGKLLTGSAILPSHTCGGDAVTENVGQASSSLPVYEVASQAIGEGQATADITLTKVALSAEGYAGTVSTAAVIVPAYEVDADGYGEYVGEVAITLPMLQLEATIAPVEALTGAYALNLAIRGLTQFDAYDYNSFATFNGVTLAAGSDGIFVISGEDDNGAAIDASFSMHGKTSEVQRMRQAVVNYRTDGEMMLRVTPEEGDDIYEYALIKSDTTLSKGRTKLGRGIKGSNWQFEVGNVDGADFEVDSIDITANPTARKVK